jgi:hypothetical protein
MLTPPPSAIPHPAASRRRRSTPGAQVFVGPFVRDEHPTGMPTLLFALRAV